MNILLITPG